MVSNKNTLIWSIVLVGLSLVLVGAVSAGITVYSGELASSDPTFDYDGYGPYYYDVYEFTVDTTGVYRMVMGPVHFFNDDKTLFFLYEGELTPGDPNQNLIAMDDNSGLGLDPEIETMLTACTQYVLVVTSAVQRDTGDYTFHIAGPGDIGSIDCGNANGGSPIAGNLLDGRINNDPALDVAAPIAVYCADNGTFDVYTINANSGEGVFAFRATTEQVTTPVAENTLLSSSLGVSVYRLATGEFSIFAAFPAGKPYAFLFDACAPTRTEHPF